MTIPYGPAVVRANLSARQAASKGLLTSGTFGPTGSTSSLSEDLQYCLESSLRQQAGLFSSILYRVTWRHRDTPARRRICALRASAARITVHGYILSGWTTPQKHDTHPRGAGNRKNPKAGNACLAWDAKETISVLVNLSSGVRTGFSLLTEQESARLNPALSRWLLRLPTELDKLGPMETLWTKKPLVNSFEQRWIQWACEGDSMACEFNGL